MHPKRLLLFTLIISFAVVLAGCAESSKYGLRSSVMKSDGLKIFKLLLKEERFKEVADRVAPLTVRVEIMKPPSPTTFDYAYSAGEVTYANDLGKPDFTLRTSRDIALAVLNADDGFRVFACAMKANAATFEATNMAYAASFNAAKGRILESASDCTADVGDKVTFRGLSGTLVDGERLANESVALKDGDAQFPPRIADMGRQSGNFNYLLVFNQWRAPTAWVADYAGIYCTSATRENLCAGAGTSVPSSDLADCAEKVKTAYKDDDEKAQAEGWGAGHVAARAADKAAEEALCQLVFGGV